MRYNAKNIKFSREKHLPRPGYVVTLADGSREWFRYQWMAIARASGWTYPDDINRDGYDAVLVRWQTEAES